MFEPVMPFDVASIKVEAKKAHSPISYKKATAIYRQSNTILALINTNLF